MDGINVNDDDDDDDDDNNNNIKELLGDKCESIKRQMQKAILSSSLHIARMFKLRA